MLGLGAVMVAFTTGTYAVLQHAIAIAVVTCYCLLRLSHIFACVVRHDNSFSWARHNLICSDVADYGKC